MVIRNNLKKKINKYREIVSKCPWCKSTKSSIWGGAIRGFTSVKCAKCDLIYIKNRFNKKGLARYYENYINEVHQSSQKSNDDRAKMYKIEFDYIAKFIKPLKDKRVLDVGCSGGYFLDLFKDLGCSTYGIEFGGEAYEMAKQKHNMHKGELPDIKIKKKFDIVIFRGVIEHVINPKKYLNKAISLLKKNGIIYITSIPNSNSLCANLYKEYWNQHEPESHLMHFNVEHFDNFFIQKDFCKLGEKHFYLETPYCDLENDLKDILKALNARKNNKDISGKSPAFFDTMLSLVYKNK